MHRVGGVPTKIKNDFEIFSCEAKFFCFEAKKSSRLSVDGIATFYFLLSTFYFLLLVTTPPNTFQHLRQPYNHYLLLSQPDDNVCLAHHHKQTRLQYWF